MGYDEDDTLFVSEEDGNEESEEEPEYDDLE